MLDVGCVNASSAFILGGGLVCWASDAPVSSAKHCGDGFETSGTSEIRSGCGGDNEVGGGGASSYLRVPSSVFSPELDCVRGGEGLGGGELNPEFELVGVRTGGGCGVLGPVDGIVPAVGGS